MLSCFRIKLILILLGLNLSMVSRAQAEVVELKNGRTFTGNIIAQSKTSYYIRTPEGDEWISITEIKRIRFDPVPLNPKQNNRDKNLEDEGGGS